MKLIKYSSAPIVAVCIVALCGWFGRLTAAALREPLTLAFDQARHSIYELYNSVRNLIENGLGLNIPG